MKYPLTILLSCLLCVVASTQENYFQQQTDYTIHAKLNDKDHLITGTWELTYINNSPDTLSIIYLHLWPNAYSSRTTAFAQQMLKNNNTELYFADDKDLGFIDSLSFSSEGEPLSTSPTSLGPDVIQLHLSEGLSPGQQQTITSPFKLKIPASFSRLGHVGQSYQLTQWYPKPAVYDQSGWHPMSYLEYGEYYSEFGNFDVYITLPNNYSIGASGVLQTEEERERLLTLANVHSPITAPVTSAFPPSDSSFKTLHYRAEHVHDFAWFADKRFLIQHDTIQLHQQTIDAWAMYTHDEAHLWKDAMDYIKRATHFYSRLVGDYPYPQVTAVNSPLSAGAGMEYPMVTVIGNAQDAQSLDLVLTHEIGHNWFYGILATNERQHAWLDEGFNSYYDHRYNRQYYPESASSLPKVLQKDSPIQGEEITYRQHLISQQHQAPDTRAEHLTEHNYWTGSYTIGAKALEQWEHYIGRAKYDTIMRQYFKEWQFKHPQVTDVKQSLEQHSGQSLDWLFDGFFQSEGAQDYAIDHVSTNDSLYLTITNNGPIAGPFPIVINNNSNRHYTSWQNGFKGTRTIALPLMPYEHISIDPDHICLEKHYYNNHFYHRSLGHYRPFRMRFLGGIPNDAYQEIFFTPLIGYNQNDGWLPSLVLHNKGIIPQRFEWLINPSYSTKSQRLVGLASARYRHWFSTTSTIRALNITGDFRRFSYRTYAPAEQSLQYLRSKVGAEVHFSHKHLSEWKTMATYRYIHTQTDLLDFSNTGDFAGISTAPQDIHEWAFIAQYKHALNPVKITTSIELARYQDAFRRSQKHNKLQTEVKGKLSLNTHQAIHWRVFGGLFLNNTIEGGLYSPPQAFSLFDRAADDYRYDNIYTDRSATSGLLDQQLGLRNGGFRAPVAAVHSIGRSNRYLLSINTSIDLAFTPNWLPIKPYFDAATYGSGLDGNTLLWNAGVALEWLDGSLGIYLPLVGSAAILDRLKESGSLNERIGFRILLTDLFRWSITDK